LAARGGSDGFGNQYIFLLSGFEPCLKELIVLGRMHFRFCQKMHLDVIRNDLEFAVFGSFFLWPISLKCVISVFLFNGLGLIAGFLSP
jgi:hypothetical protein